MSAVAEATWQRCLGQALVVGGVEVAAWVPDKRLAPIADALAGEGVPLRTLTREEECIGYAAGYRAVGGTPLVLLQCSGLGNSYNAIGSLVVPYGYGFPMIVSMRGTLTEANVGQVPLGRATVDMLALLGIQSFSLRKAADIPPAVSGVMQLTGEARQLAALILEPELEL